MRVIDGIYFALDTAEPVAVGKGESCLKGWFVPEQDASDVALSIVVDGIARPVFTGLKRPDVSEHLGRPLQEKCGFVARFKNPVVEPTVTLVAETPSGTVTLASVPVSQQPDLSFPRKQREPVSNYKEWLRFCEVGLFWPDSEISDRISGLAYQPLISIILPTYNTDPYFLSCCLRSVRDQRYTNWQLCVVDDCSSDRRVVEYLKNIAAEDSRIVFARRTTQGNISAASNSALERARGEYIVLLDHDDELHPFALLEVVRYLNLCEDAQLIYSDEDKIDTLGVRSQPAFKPDFDPDMFWSFDYLGHLIALRRNVVTEVGGFRSECDGSQDWDLLVRAVERIGFSAVHHIPKPLYHWRMHEDSTAFSLEAKPYAAKAWFRVLSDHVCRVQVSATPEKGLFRGSMQLSHRPCGSIKTAAIVRADDGSVQASTLFSHVEKGCTRFYQLAGCILHKLPVTAPPRTSFVTTDIKDGAGCFAAEHELISVRSIAELKDQVFVFINGQLETVNHRFFHELTAQAMREDVGLVTGLSVNSHRSILHAGFIRSENGDLIDPFAGLEFPQHGYMGQLSVVRRVEGISPHFFAVRRECLVGAGGMGVISSSHMRYLVSRLLTYARIHELRVLVTPYAIGTFTGNAERPLCTDGQIPPSYRSVRINPNLGCFTDLHSVMQGNL